MCLACYTQDEIAAAVGCTHQAVDAVLQKTADLPEIAKPAANHLTDFDIPLYNVARDKKIADMWLACYTQDEIAAAVGGSVQVIKDVVSDKTAELPEYLKPAANHLTDSIPVHVFFEISYHRACMDMYLCTIMNE